MERLDSEHGAAWLQWPTFGAFKRAYLVACCRLTAASRLRDILTQWETETQRKACVSAQCTLPEDGWYRCTKWLTISSSHTCLEGIPWLSVILWSQGPKRFSRRKGRAKSAYRPGTGRVIGVWFWSGSVSGSHGLPKNLRILQPTKTVKTNCKTIIRPVI